MFRVNKYLNNCSLDCLLLNKLAESKLFGPTCNLLVSCETTREVVQIFVGPGKRVEACRVQKMFEPLVQKIMVDEWFKGSMGQQIG